VLLTRVLLLLLGPVAVAAVMMAPTGAGAPYPWTGRLPNRRRDGRAVLNHALRHLREVFIEIPKKVLLAPSTVELLMNPGDLTSLSGFIEVELVSSIATEYYAAEVALRGARLASDRPVKVRVTSDPAIQPGRYRFRRDQRVAISAGDQLRAWGQNGPIRRELASATNVGIELTTPREPAVNPPLRLVTNGSIAETRVSGARAGRGREVELPLPEEPTVSRVHAEFIFAESEWWIIGRGRNGLVLNGALLSGKHVVRPGDAIHWGCQDGALVSRVEIGADQGFYAGKQ